MVDCWGVSAPGIDGIPFTAWKNSRMTAKEKLHYLHHHIISGWEIVDEFNYSLVFAADGDEDDEHIEW